MRWMRVLALMLALAVGFVAAQGCAARSSLPEKPGVIAEVALRELPAEARATLVLIRAGGPYPYSRDGVVFGNYERLLPAKERGYYREYTVPTPGERSRGARRIVRGRDGELYYTDDHYRSFRRVRE